MNQPETSPRRPGARAALLRRLPILVIALVALAGTVMLRDQLTFAALAEHREALLAYRDAHYALAAAAFIAVYVVIVAFSLPGATLATLTGGFLFGVFPGVVFNAAAATIGATAIFLAARAGFGEDLARRMETGNTRIRRLKAGINDNELSMLFLIRLVPVVPFFVANLLPAMVGVRTGRFVLTTFFGILPGGLVYTSVGAGLGTVMARGETPDLGIIFEPAILGPLLGLAALAALPVVIRAWRGRAIA